MSHEHWLSINLIQNSKIDQLLSFGKLPLMGKTLVFFVIHHTSSKSVNFKLFFNENRTLMLY